MNKDHGENTQLIVQHSLSIPVDFADILDLDSLGFNVKDGHKGSTLKLRIPFRFISSGLGLRPGVIDGAISILAVQNQEKMKRKKLMSNKEETRQVETNSVTMPQYVQDKLVNEQGAASVDKLVSGVTATDAATKTPTVIVNGGNKDRQKQEKLKGNSNDVKITKLVVKKKSKRKAESELGEAVGRSDKLNSENCEERKKKSVKQSAGSSPKTDLQSVAAAPSYDNMQ